MGCGDVRLLRTIGGVDVTGQERAALNKLTMPLLVIPSALATHSPGRWKWTLNSRSFSTSMSRIDSSVHLASVPNLHDEYAQRAVLKA